MIDEVRKKIGFRCLEKKGDMDFVINGLPLKLWGANMAPLDNKTGCYQKERAEKNSKNGCRREYELPSDLGRRRQASGQLL